MTNNHDDEPPNNYTPFFALMFFSLCVSGAALVFIGDEAGEELLVTVGCWMGFAGFGFALLGMVLGANE